MGQSIRDIPSLRTAEHIKNKVTLKRDTIHFSLVLLHYNYNQHLRGIYIYDDIVKHQQNSIIIK